VKVTLCTSFQNQSHSLFCFGQVSAFDCPTILITNYGYPMMVIIIIWFACLTKDYQVVILCSCPLVIMKHDFVEVGFVPSFMK